MAIPVRLRGDGWMRGRGFSGAGDNAGARDRAIASTSLGGKHRLENTRGPAAELTGLASRGAPRIPQLLTAVGGNPP